MFPNFALHLVKTKSVPLSPLESSRVPSSPLGLPSPSIADGLGDWKRLCDDDGNSKGQDYNSTHLFSDQSHTHLPRFLKSHGPLVDQSALARGRYIHVHVQPPHSSSLPGQARETGAENENGLRDVGANQGNNAEVRDA